MTIYIYIAASLDNFIATPDGGLDWLYAIPNPEQSDYGFADFIQRVDALVMGRKTFETVLSFEPWPYQKPVFVLSRTLAALPEKAIGKAELIRWRSPPKWCEFWAREDFTTSTWMADAPSRVSLKRISSTR